MLDILGDFAKPAATKSSAKTYPAIPDADGIPTLEQAILTLKERAFLARESSSHPSCLLSSVC